MSDWPDRRRSSLRLEAAARDKRAGMRARTGQHKTPRSTHLSLLIWVLYLYLIDCSHVGVAARWVCRLELASHAVCRCTRTACHRSLPHHATPNAHALGPFEFVQSVTCCSASQSCLSRLQPRHVQPSLPAKVCTFTSLSSQPP